MSTLVVIGTQWGDEGKGKVVHFLGKNADYIVRSQGGNNAGHTVILPDNRVSIQHIVPSGILLKNKKCLITNGVVIDPEVLFQEIGQLKKSGISVKGRLFISESAHIILPYHKYLDELHERARVRIGTTKRGIGPCYGDKVTRLGIRVIDYITPHIFYELASRNIREKSVILKKIISRKKIEYETYKNYNKLRNFIKPFVTDTSLILEKALKEKKNILFEGAQGTLLDLDFGTYPYVTSSNPVAGGVCTGAGIGPTEIDIVLGVTKAYTTRVGSGPFPTELKNELGELLRKRGQEYGATTGRPRRCGWFDAVIVRHAVRVNSITQLVLTKLDCLSGINPLKICYAYRYKGKLIKEFPSSREIQANAEPVYETLPGFDGDIKGITDFNKLPINARRYFRRIEELTGRKICIISLGRKRDEVIVIDNIPPWF